jgi:hypothetical protein
MLIARAGCTYSLPPTFHFNTLPKSWGNDGTTYSSLLILLADWLKTQAKIT